MLPMCSASPRLNFLQHFNVSSVQRVGVVTFAIGFDVSVFPLSLFFRSALFVVLRLLLMVHVLVRRVVPFLVTCLVLFHCFLSPGWRFCRCV